ncbi:MAG: hypothetical protein ACI8R4_003255, partial [Paracoccaceae bacterium]
MTTKALMPRSNLYFLQQKHIVFPQNRPKDEAARAAMACVAGVVGWPERCTFNNLAYLFDDWDFLNRQ